MNKIKMFGVLLILAISGGCSIKPPTITTGMDQNQVDQLCMRAWPPAYPVHVSMTSVGLRTTYRQKMNGVSSYITVDDDNGCVIGVYYSAFAR